MAIVPSQEDPWAKVKIVCRSGEPKFGNERLETVWLVIPLYSSGVNSDVLALNTLAANPSNFVGYVFYLNSAGIAADTANASEACKAAFNIGHRWYFNRNGQWHPDPFFYVG